MNLIDGLVEVTLNDDDSFLKIKETLTRIGVASKKDKTLYQTCHILHKKGKYYIMMFKELFLLDGKHADITEDDIARRNTIIKLLDDWGLVRVVNKAMIAEPRATMNQIKVISYNEKDDWSLESKYTVGKKNKNA